MTAWQRRLASVLCLVLLLAGLGHLPSEHPSAAPVEVALATQDADCPHRVAGHAGQPAVQAFAGDLLAPAAAGEVDCGDAACCGLCASLIVAAPTVPPASSRQLRPPAAGAADHRLPPSLQPPRTALLA